MNNHLLRLAAARLGLFLAPFLVSLLGWLGLVNPEDVPKAVALVSNHLTELVFGVFLLIAGIVANLKHELARTDVALSLPKDSTRADLQRAVKQRGPRPVARRVPITSAPGPGIHHDDDKKEQR